MTTLGFAVVRLRRGLGAARARDPFAVAVLVGRSPSEVMTIEPQEFPMVRRVSRARPYPLTRVPLPC